MKRILFVITLVALALALGASPAIASDQTIVGVSTFASLDGSAQDDDHVVNGVLTVTGNLTIAGTGAITCNDPPAFPNLNDSACPIRIDVRGNMTMQAGSAIVAENQQSGGLGGAIRIDVGVTMTMQGGSKISSSDTSVGGNPGGAGSITITVGKLTAAPPTGTFEMAAGAQIQANGAGSSGGDILITVGHTANVAGVVESAVDSGRTGTGANQGRDGASINITAGCGLTIAGTATVSSRGKDAGADLVHLEGCEVTIRGTVESTGEGHATPNNPPNHCNGNGHPADSTGCIEVWGQNVVIDGGTLSTNKDVNTACNGREWIEVFAEQNVTIRGGSASALQASHPCANTQTAGVITVMAQKGNITMSGRAVEADAVAAGGDGGILTVQAGGNVNLSTAVLRARGDSVQTGGFGKGGMLGVRSFNGTLTWTGGEGDVSPTGSNPQIPAGNRGVITLEDCTPGPIDLNGTSFPSDGAPTTPMEIPDNCVGAPAIPTYVVFRTGVWAACRQPPPPDTATKSGRKFNDLQGDGNDASDPGLGGWEIRAYADNAPKNGVLDGTELAAGPVATTTTSAGSGAYSFTLAPGSYIVCEVQKAGWTQTFPTGAPAECDAGPSLGAQGYAVTLAAGVNHPGNAFGNREPEPERVTVNICHATGDEDPVYRPASPEILVNGALKDDEFDNHREHGGDIIPPYSYFDANGGSHEFVGQNWGDQPGEGQEIWNNDCVPPTPEPPPDPDPITPAAECVEPLAGGGFRAHFGYDNPNDDTLVILVGPGNAFSPGDPFRNQPTEFLTGPHGDVVQVESASGEPLTWTVTKIAATATLESPKCEGSITINKLLNPADDPGLFNLEIDGESVRAEGPAGDGDTTGPIAVKAGTHTVGESGAATNLSRYDTQIVCRPGSGAGAVVAGANSVSTQVTVGRGDAIVCDITNTRKQPLPLTPVLECVVINAGGPDVAVWGYENPNDHAVEIDVGNLNRFSPGDQDRGQPTTFEPGPFAAVFQTPFEAGAGGLTWTLTGNTATASSSSPPCTQPQPPQPPPDVLDLELTKTASPTTVRVGELITWTMIVTNPSTVAAGDVSGARVDDRPFRTELVSLTTSQGTCSPPDGCNLGRLLPGGSVTVTAVTRATQVGEIVNCVRVGSEEIESGYLNNTACAVVHVTGDAPPILDRCRSLVVSPRLLRVARESIVLVTARNLLGRPLARVGVRARGAGITALARTNARGIARFVFIAPRLGTIRFRGVGQGTRTLTANGCKTRLGVLPGRQPPPLTGRAD